MTKVPSRVAIFFQFLSSLLQNERQRSLRTAVTMVLDNGGRERLNFAQIEDDGWAIFSLLSESFGGTLTYSHPWIKGPLR